MHNHGYVIGARQSTDEDPHRVRLVINFFHGEARDVILNETKYEILGSLPTRAVCYFFKVAYCTFLSYFYPELTCLLIFCSDRNYKLIDRISIATFCKTVHFPMFLECKGNLQVQPIWQFSFFRWNVRSRTSGAFWHAGLPKEQPRIIKVGNCIPIPRTLYFNKTEIEQEKILI